MKIVVIYSVVQIGCIIDEDRATVIETDNLNEDILKELIAKHENLKSLPNHISISQIIKLRDAIDDPGYEG